MNLYSAPSAIVPDCTITCYLLLEIDVNMELKAGKYVFDCYPMPWSIYELGISDDLIKVSIELSIDDIKGLIKMMEWAWENNWFDHSTSETAWTTLLKMHMPIVFYRVHPLVVEQFLSKYPDSKNITGFGIFDIYIPDEILDYACDY